MYRKQSPVQAMNINPELHCSVPDQRRLLAASPYLQSLNPTQIEGVQRRILQRHYQEGLTIHRAGEPATRLAIVAAGSVKLVRSTVGGKDVVLDLLAPGDHFGSLAELGDQVYRATAIAQTACCILSMDSDEFAQLLITYPAVARDSLAIVAQRLNAAESTIEQLSSSSVEHRVVQSLLHLAAKIGVERDGATLIDVPLSRQDLADMTGTTVESASRVMSDLRRAGEIESGRRWIAILNADALKARVN